MKKNNLFLVILLVISSLTSCAQDPFVLYSQKDDSWNPAIFELYIKQYSGIDVDKILIEPKDLNSIKEVLKDFSYTETEDLDQAIDAVARGKKVFFFIETYVWGGLNSGTVQSGSWGREMPICSGFYIYEEDKCFQNEGINYHCGKKDQARKTVFFIMD